MASKTFDFDAKQSDIVGETLSGDDVRNVETRKEHECEGCGRPTATWKFYCRKFLCDMCKGEVPFRTISRSEAMKTFKLTWQELVDAQRLDFLTVYTVPNPHARGLSRAHQRRVAPMRLYLFHQVEMFAKKLHKGLILLDASQVKMRY